MSTISIGGAERELAQVDPQWITQQIAGRRGDGQNVCIIVRIRTANLNITLSTPECGGGGGRGRPPTHHERAVLDLWSELGLNEHMFAPGAAVAFVQRVRQFL